MGEATRRTPAERALERAREGTRKQIAKREEMKPYIKSRAQDAARSKVGGKTRANLSGVKPTGKKVAKVAASKTGPEVRKALDVGPASEEEAQKRWAAGMERAKQGVSKDRLDAHRANIDRRRTARLGMSERRAPVRGSAADRGTGRPGGGEPPTGGGEPTKRTYNVKTRNTMNWGVDRRAENSPRDGSPGRGRREFPKEDWTRTRSGQNSSRVSGSLTDEFKGGFTKAGKAIEEVGAGAMKGAIKSKRHNLLGLATGAALGAAASTETGRRAIGAIKEKAKEGVDLLRKGMDKVGLTKPEQQEGLRMTQKTLLKKPPRRVTHARGR